MIYTYDEGEKQFSHDIYPVPDPVIVPCHKIFAVAFYVVWLVVTGAIKFLENLFLLFVMRPLVEWKLRPAFSLNILFPDPNGVV
jgi:hypothetical protein